MYIYIFIHTGQIFDSFIDSLFCFVFFEHHDIFWCVCGVKLTTQLILCVNKVFVYLSVYLFVCLSIRVCVFVFVCERVKAMVCRARVTLAVALWCLAPHSDAIYMV